MTTQAAVDGFLAEKSLAVVGVSERTTKFGRVAFNELKAKGYRVFPVNRRVESIGGEHCYPSLLALPEAVGGALVVVPPHETEQVVKDAAAAGIRRVWLQQGSESAAAIGFCRANGIEVVDGHCILMFARPAAFYHRFHHWLWGVLGKLPH